MQLIYTIRVNNVIVAKADYKGIAATIAAAYKGDKSVKIIDNTYNRVAYNNRGKVHTFAEIFDVLVKKDEQFKADYWSKNS